MTIEELLLWLVRIYGNPTGKQGSNAALLVRIGNKAEGWNVIGKAKGQGAGTPASWILTSMAAQLGPEGSLRDCCLVLNYFPSDWCLGLAWLLDVRFVIYSDGNQLRAVKTGTNGVEGEGFPSWNLSDWNLNCSFNQKSLKFEFAVDGYAKPKPPQLLEKQHLLATINSVATAPAFVRVQMGGVIFSEPPMPDCSFVPMPGSALRDDLFTRAAFGVVNQTWKHAQGGRPDGLKGHNIGALAVAPNDCILGWAVNVSQVSRCCHAESLLILGLLRKGYNLANLRLRIYCTLEPCHMCAGMITTFCPNAKVIYGMADSNIQNSCLARKRRGCEQLLAKTILNNDVTIPAFCLQLREQFGADGPITGFLDAPNAARRAFRLPRERLQDQAVAPRNAIAGIQTRMVEINALPDDRRRMMNALLDLRPKQTVLHESAPLTGRIAPSMVPPRRPELMPVSNRWGVHYPLVLYLDDFLRHLSMQGQ